MRSLELQSTIQATLSITCTISAISAFRQIAVVRAAPALGHEPCTGPNRRKLRIKVALRYRSDWRGALGRGRTAASKSFNLRPKPSSFLRGRDPVECPFLAQSGHSLRLTMSAFGDKADINRTLPNVRL